MADARPSAADRVAEARAGVDAEFGPLLAICEAMRDIALEVVEPWRGRPMEERTIDRPLGLMLTRATTTFWGLIELLRMGFGDQGAMLARSLFEDMVDMHWMTVEPDAAIDRLPKHGEHADMLMTDALRADPDLLDGEHLHDYDKARRAELDKLFGKFGERGWTGQSIYARVNSIEHLWAADEHRTLRFAQRVIHRSNNQTLHVSAAGLASLIRGEDSAGMRLRVGPARDGIDRVTFGAWWTYSQVLRLVLSQFDFPDADQGAWDRLYLDGFDAFHGYNPNG